MKRAGISVHPTEEYTSESFDAHMQQVEGVDEWYAVISGSKSNLVAEYREDNIYEQVPGTLCRLREGLMDELEEFDELLFNGGFGGLCVADAIQTLPYDYVEGFENVLVDGDSTFDKVEEGADENTVVNQIIKDDEIDDVSLLKSLYYSPAEIV